MLGRLHRRVLDSMNPTNYKDVMDRAKEIDSYRTDKFIKKTKDNKNYIGPFDVGDSDQVYSDDSETFDKHYNMYKKRDERSKK